MTKKPKKVNKAKRTLKDPDDLTPRQRAFVEAYLVDLNGTQSAIKAGYSEKTAAQLSSQLLRNIKIQEAIEKAKAARSMRTQITADRVLEELARIAFSDLRNVAAFGHIGDKNVFSIKNSEDMSDDAAATISEIKVKRTFKPNPMTDDDGNPEPPIEVEEASVKMHDKLGSLRLLAKHLGLTPDKVEHMGKDGGPIQIREELDISNLSPKELALYAKIKAANPDD